MSLRQYNFWIISFLLPILFSCSTTKKGFINQEYHTLTTKYNVLFNGKEAFLIGEAILEEAFEDNFFDIVYCFQVMEHVFEPVKIIKEFS